MGSGLDVSVQASVLAAVGQARFYGALAMVGLPSFVAVAPESGERDAGNRGTG